MVAKTLGQGDGGNPAGPSRRPDRRRPQPQRTLAVISPSVSFKRSPLPGVCRGCAAPTQPRNSKSGAYEYCEACHPGPIATRWIAARVRDSMRASQDRYDRLPSSYHWSRTHARAAALKRWSDSMKASGHRRRRLRRVPHLGGHSRGPPRRDMSPRERSPAATHPLVRRRGPGVGPLAGDLRGSLKAA